MQSKQLKQIKTTKMKKKHYSCNSCLRFKLVNEHLIKPFEYKNCVCTNIKKKKV